MPVFFHAFFSLLEHTVMSFLIAKYLYIISYSYSTLAVLICLANLPVKVVLTHPLLRGILRNLYLSKGVEGCYEWWWCIKLQIAISLFCIYFWRKNVELHNFVINCILLLLLYWLTILWTSSFMNHALFSNLILLFFFSPKSTGNATLCGVCTLGLLGSNSTHQLNLPMSSQHSEYIHFMCSLLLICSIV